MGALHAGHLSLVKKSVSENKITVVSLFVNPIQFGPKEDFKRYPRPWREDRRMLAKQGVAILFSPEPSAMYFQDHSTRVEVQNMTDSLCGSPHSRGPGHFVGVATVAAKLFNLVRPTSAYFGMKDFQQMRVIETMNRDLNFGIRIVRCPTVREKDGLALSSRNQYLSECERRLAPRLYLALQYGRKLLTSHARMSPQAVSQKVQGALTSTPEFKIDYIEVVDPETLKRPTSFKRPLLLAAAIWLGKTRLIDNILIN